MADNIKLTIDSGAGDDTIFGSRGADMLVGGAGNDFIDGQQGDDVAKLGAGDDTFRWNRAMAATPSKARTASTRFYSTARA